ncbi:GMC family oxidoreductase N-terminal domain-containing protein [soil metagenome]
MNFDYIIVGAGSAGCVLANRLSADPDASVLLLEAGGKDDWMWIHIPVGYLYCIGNPRTDWLFKTREEAGLNGRSLGYPRGKVLGGSSSMNGMIYMRGQAADYEHWKALGNPGWGWDDVLPMFKKSEDHHSPSGDAEFHGHDGELRVERQRLSWKILDQFREAASQAGIPKIDDFNRGDNFGCGYFEVNQKNGFRWNASKAFLRPALKRPNLTVVTGAHVRHLNFDGVLCTGLTYVKDGRPINVKSRAETILSAGAIGTPHILELSGIGDAEVLRGLGLKPRHVLSGVGANLQDHLQLRMAFKLKKGRTLNSIANSWHGKTWMALQYALARRGPMSMAPSQLGAFARSNERVEHADLEYHVQPLSLDRFGDPLHTFPAFTASVCHLRPSSRGTVHASSRDYTAAPHIAPNYLSTDADRKVAVDAIRLTRRIAAQPALSAFSPEEFMPGTQFDNDEELARAAGTIGTTIFHPAGSCKMGPAGDPRAVVGATLKVHGMGGLRIVDASIMPTITSGNTHAPTVMIAEKAAQMILQSRADHA